jgi:phosphopantothenoylcysteine decarboxylase/phosphopantothenate--cysteine ligase
MARILLAASASVALYKACDLASQLTQGGHQVRAVLTRNAARLIRPQLFEAVSGEPAFSDEFDETRRGAMDHIELAQWGQALVVAPCSADLAARLALGLGDDLVTTLALAFPSANPRLVCPAMNPVMLAAPAVRRNLGLLESDGWEILAPEEGHMACGTEGRGRLPDPHKIAAWLDAHCPR